MTTDKIKNRYIILAFGACVQFCYGIAYVWSMFQPYAITKYSLDTSAANQPFGIMLGVFAIGNLIGGFLQKKLNATFLIYVGSTIMCLGLFATAYVPVDKPWLLNITYGVIVGLGCGIAYNTLLATMQKWFPDKRGMVTGIIVCSAGLFGLIMNPIAQHFLVTGGFTIAMTVVAGSLYVICISCAWVIKAPPKGYMEDYRPVNIPTTSKQYTIREMLGTKQYYIIAFSFMLAVPAYFLINPMLMSLGVDRGLSTGVALLGVMLVSVMNTTGRLTAPWISDRIGRKPLLLFLFLFSTISVSALTIATGNLFLILIACIALAYGGFMGMYPTISSDYFGIKNAGVNYGVVMLGYAICSVGCPYIVRAVKLMPMGTAFSFVIAAAASIVGFILLLGLRKPE
jgi:MFS transporter, OFA family, oxalate/formate antiporter